MAAPTVTAISAAAGPLAGGTPMTITGTGFSGATEVDFGSGHAATNLDVVSATQITVTSPAESTAGTVDVTVTGPGGTSTTSSADQFTYVAAPTVSGVSPAAATGGTTVTITGTGFSGATAVDFGSGNPATNLDRRFGDEDHGHEPGRYRHGGRNGDHGPAVPRPRRRPTSSPTWRWPVSAPTAGPSAGGTPVTITGSGFTGATAVDFGGTGNPATNVQVVSLDGDHGREPGGHGHGGRDGDWPGRHDGDVLCRPVHLRGGADGDGCIVSRAGRDLHRGDDDPDHRDLQRSGQRDGHAAIDAQRRRGGQLQQRQRHGDTDLQLRRRGGAKHADQPTWTMPRPHPGA